MGDAASDAYREQQSIDHNYFGQSLQNRGSKREFSEQEKLRECVRVFSSGRLYDVIGEIKRRKG